MQTTVQLHSLKFDRISTYFAAAVFICGNIVLPQLLHTVHGAGPTWLPIYFFTLVGAYKYGWRVGLLTALLSPTINSLLFGMPAPEVLPAILLKSTLLAVSASMAARHFGKVTFLSLFCVVLGYQVAGTLGEWALTGDFAAATQDFRMGIPGMLLQIAGGRAIIGMLKK